MNAAHKILTVSYGTFSCTLEGFDDPFNTMKAIAEYFRDLAAEDRYFGAEPPQPDAAMLHKIAEREIQRRVEAKIQDNGVVLRARDADEVAPAAPAPEPIAAPVAVAVSPVVEVAAPRPAPAMLAEEAAAAAMASAAQRLQRLRAAQAHTIAPTPAPVAARPAGALVPGALVKVVLAPPAEPPAAVEAAPLPERVAEVAAEVAPVAGPVFEAVNAAAEAVHPVAAPEAVEPALTETAPEVVEPAATEAFEAEAAAAGPVVAPVIETAEVAEPALQPEAQIVEPAAQPEAEVDALLSRLASVQPEDVAAEVVAASPAPVGPAAIQDGEDVLAALRETLAGSLDADTLAPAAEDLATESTDAALAAEATAESPDESAPEVAAELPAALTAETFPEGAAEDAAFGHSDASPAQAEVAPVAPLSPFPDEETLLAADEDRLTAEAFPAEDRAPAFFSAEAAASEAAGFAPEAAPEEAAAEARATDASAGTDDPDLDLEPETAAPEAFDPAPEAPDQGAPQVADKIQRARARVIKIRRIDAQPAPAAAPVVQLPDPVVPHRLPAAETDEAAVERLVQKTNTELEEPQTKRRRSAIAHLKAAVLATVAERRANLRRPDDNLRQDPYRKDLDEVMRPAGGATAAAPAPEKPAPLVLLPTLRVNHKPAPEPATVLPVRPRRVTSSAALAQRPAFAPEEDELAAAEVENVFNEAPAAPVAGQSFQDFADDLGAQSLQDLIEAAGAYLTLNKGRDAFTRPELFAEINALGSEPSREDGLRGFGRLLREGRLAKTDAGLYSLTETSPLLAQAKRRAS